MTNLIPIPFFALESISTVIYSVLLPTAIVVLLCFLPCIIELKRPRDAGPRLIHPAFQGTLAIHSLKLMDAEASLVTSQPKERISILPVFLTNLEA